MIVNIYFAILLFSLLIIALGFWVKNPTLEIVGYFFLFCLGLVMMTGSIEYSTGSVSVTEDNVTTKILSYTNFDEDTSGEVLGLFSLNHLFGVLMSVFGGFGIAITLFNMRMEK